MSVKSSNDHVVFFFKETTPGTGLANAAAYVADEGTDTFQHYVSGKLDPAWIRQQSVANTQNVSSHFQSYGPIKGLKSADGGSMVLIAAGSGAATADASQIAEVGLHEILQNALGGLHRSNTTTPSAVTNDYTFTLTADTNYADGQLIGVEDTDDTDNLVYVAQVLSKSGSDVTTDREMPFTLATADSIHALATLYPDSSVLEDPDDANHLTHTVGVEVNESVWLAHGCAFQLDSVSWVRGEECKFSFSIMAGSVSPPGDDGFNASPAFTGTVQGNAGFTVGCDSEVILQQTGTTARLPRDVIEFSFTAGVPRLPLNTVTSVNAGMCGLRGHGVGVGETEVDIKMHYDDEESANEFQNSWEANTEYYCTMYQKDTAGRTIAVHCQRIVQREAPEYVGGEASKEIMTRWKALERTSGATAMAKAKFHIGIG